MEDSKVIPMKFFAKRVSTYFDKECGDSAHPPWIQDIYPPIAETFCACDIIRRVPTNGCISKAGEATDYMLILTPSCDMAQNKVSDVLCAKCNSKTEFHKFPTNTNPPKKQLERIASYLNEGYSRSLVALPHIPEILPYMTADLKDVYILPIDQIALDEKNITPQHNYCRVASVDSPFREQIVWAHLINSCRPGVPNRNTDLWARELMTP